MPGFRTHTTINLAMAAGLTAAAIERDQFPLGLVVIACASFAVATVFLSPDLDLRHSSPTRNWGPLRWLWRPYQLVFKHRGASHSLLLSSVTRIAYLLAVVAVAFGSVRPLAGAAMPTSHEALALAASPESVVPSALRAGLWSFRWEFAAVGAGIFLSDLTHIVADRLVSAVKGLAGAR